MTGTIAACGLFPPTNILTLCEADAPNVEVISVFRVQEVRELQKHIPASDFGPIVASVTQPGFVVVFRRPYRVVAENQSDSPIEWENVACAYYEEAAHIYSHLDLTGFSPW
jgi:hypothetical protein